MFGRPITITAPQVETETNPAPPLAVASAMIALIDTTSGCAVTGKKSIPGNGEACGQGMLGMKPPRIMPMSKSLTVDYRVVEVCVDRHHGTHGAVVFGVFGDNRDTRSAAVRRREANQITGFVVADGGQRAQVVAVELDPGTTAEQDLVVGRGGRGQHTG
jgi:hypothetical protein